MAATDFAAPILLRQGRIGSRYQATQSAWPGLVLALLLVLAASLAGCSAIDPSKISVNIDPEEVTSVGW